MVHNRFPQDCRAEAFEERLIARATLELFVAAETLETVVSLKPAAIQLWSLLVLKKLDADEAAARHGCSIGTMRTQFHRLRDSAIESLAARWSEPDDERAT